MLFIRRLTRAVWCLALIFNGPVWGGTSVGLGKASAERGVLAIRKKTSNPGEEPLAVTFTGPSASDVGRASAHFMIAVSGDISGTILFTPSDSPGGGTFIPSSVQINKNTPTGSFVYIANGSGTKTISLDNNALLARATLTLTAVDNNTLPTWVPAEGEVAVLTQSNGLLTNTYYSTCATYYEPFFHYHVNDFSTTVLNPYFGTYGALLLFGGGHSSNNDNSVTALELRASSCTWRRLTDPSPIFGGPGPVSNDIKALNSQGVTQNTPHRNDTYGEYPVDGQPCSEHSYSTLDVLGPTEGGGPEGTLIIVMAPSVAASGALSVQACHELEFGLTDPPHWRRRTNNVNNVFLDSMFYTVHVPSQNRVYYDAHIGNNVRWFDLQTDTYVNGTGAGFDRTGQGANTGIMFYVAERGLVVYADANCSGPCTLRLQYMDVTVDQPSWVTTVTLDTPLPVNDIFSTAAWCPDNHRIIVGAVKNDNSAVYEIAIPSTLSGSWTVTRAPFGPGQTIDFPEFLGDGKWSYKRWAYNPRTKSILFLPTTGNGGNDDDKVYVYRPRGT